jgi:hypothetical protein
MQGRLDEAIEALRLAIDSGHPEFAPQALALLAELDGQQPSTPTPRPVATVVTTVSHRRLVLQPHLLFVSLVVCASGAGLVAASPS